MQSENENVFFSSIKIFLSSNTDVRSISMDESLLVEDRKDDVLDKRKFC